MKALMKALEVLKKAAVFSEHSTHYPSLSDFDEAIAELEALENRSCENCRHVSRQSYREPCNSCKRLHQDDNWEAKQ